MSSEKREHQLYWKCRQCGKSSPISAEYCRNPLCGADLNLYGDISRDEHIDEIDPNNHTSIKIIAGILLLVLLVLMLFAFRAKPDDPVETLPVTETHAQHSDPTQETTAYTLPPEPTLGTVPHETCEPTDPPEATVPIIETTTPTVVEETSPPETISEEILDGYYEGPVEDGNPHGDGQLTWPGGTYIGEFTDGYPNGSGSFLYDDGTRVESGHWSYGSADYLYPAGKLQGSSAGTYTGLLKNGEPYGYGRLQLGVGSHYNGIFFAGQPCGKGSFQTAKGISISGNWSWTVNQPDSLDLSRNGSTVRYTGMTCDNIICGFGSLTLEKCGTFYGEFMDGEANGSGLYVYQSYQSEDDAVRFGDNWGMVHKQYLGQFEHTYTGLVLNGVWEGFGLGIKNSGSHYVGEIKDYHRHGYGRLYLKGNSLYQEGVFVWGTLK